MSIAYFLMAHDNIGQLTRLVRAIHDPAHCILVHVDAKSPASFRREVAQLAGHWPNVHLMRSRSVRWASWSVIDTTLEGMRELLALDSRWTHFWNLSGQDFPLRPQRALIEHLREHRDTNFVKVFDPLTNWRDGESRIRRIRLEIPGLRDGVMVPRLRTNRWQRHLGSRRYWGGSSYFTLTRALCEDLLGSDEMPAYRRFFRLSYTGDEIFIPTFVMNSKWRDTISNDNLRLIDFSEGTPRPRTWTTEHREQLLESPAWFARKFDSRVDAPILDFLEQRLAA